MTTTHDKWAHLPTLEIQKYLQKYSSPTAPGKASPRRKRKIKFFQNILAKREKAIHLLTQGT